MTDLEFLKTAFNKLLLNFTWWVNRKDRFGKNVFEGGFLGLDNIGVFDRSAPLPTGGYLEQADGTAWMALFTPEHDRDGRGACRPRPGLRGHGVKFAEHFFWIAAAMNRPGTDGMWDEEDGFYYDVLRLPDGSATRLKVRSMVGLLPLCAATVVEQWQRERVPQVFDQCSNRLRRMPGARWRPSTPPARVISGWPSAASSRCVNPERLRRILARMLDEERVPEPLRHPRALAVPRASIPMSSAPAARNTGWTTFRPSRTPACSAATPTGAGPVWMPVNALIIRALLQLLPVLRRQLQGRMPHRLRQR